MGVMIIDCIAHLRCVRCGKPWEEKETMHVRVGRMDTMTGLGCDCHERVLMDMKNMNHVLCLECYEELSISLHGARDKIESLNNRIDNYEKAVKLLAGCIRDEANDNDRHRES